MKTRIGFVSNSSSSSFMIIGNEFEFNELKNINTSNFQIFMRGDYFNEGCDIVKLNNEMIKYILKNEEIFRRFEFYESYVSIIENKKYTLADFKNLENREFNIFNFEREQHSSDNLKELKENYTKQMEN